MRGSSEPLRPGSKANAELLEEIKKSHKKSDGTYGAPRIHADLPKEMGASLNRVARVMCDVGIQGVTRRKWTKTTVRAMRTNERRGPGGSGLHGDGPRPALGG